MMAQNITSLDNSFNRNHDFIRDQSEYLTHQFHERIAAAIERALSETKASSSSPGKKRGRQMLNLATLRKTDTLSKSVLNEKSGDLSLPAGRLHGQS